MFVNSFSNIYFDLKNLVLRARSEIFGYAEKTFTSV